jgi:DMSO/TMAO reductase YedYZ molybdopterin-dependent catalytic subunit
MFQEVGTPGAKPDSRLIRTKKRPADSSEAMIIREKEPVNLEMPFASLEDFITPNERFYVRCHFPIPQIDVHDWKLKIEGAVERPMEFTYDEICGFEVRDLTATIECAGNSRVFLVPKVKGVQWELGAVGNAEWTGITLADMLQRVGVKSSAREVILVGADSGAIAEPPHPAGKVHFARSLSIDKAMKDVVLAYKMNGAALPASHGFPLRAVVPGWYGMASIKWLQRIIVTEELFQGYYQTVDYAYWQPGDAGPELVPLSRMEVKAEIARPGINEVVAPNDNYVIRGAAWTSGAEIAKVEITTDAGARWREAKLLAGAGKNTWRFWEFDWRTPSGPGRYTVMARATDSRGRTQPDHRDANRGTYMVNHCLPIDVEVR